MSRIFLSHSSNDNVAAVAVRDWLNENGWDDIFLDLDPAEGIHPGERWERALHERATRCEAVLFLVSHNWLSSEWCRREHELARKLNKRVFVVLIDDIAIKDLPLFLTETIQAVSLASGEDHQLRRVTLPGTHEEHHVTFSTEGLARLKAGLSQAGLDPRFFIWPPVNEPNRSPYRGLEPLENVDAGIFFGRDAPVIEALDALRGLREGACPRLFVILGASGAGKSSFLRAGLLPRLTRDDRSFLPLAAIRPGRAAIAGVDGLVAALSAACTEKEVSTTRVDLREATAKGAATLRPYLQELVARAGAVSAALKPPTLVIAVDQAEELFRAEGATEGENLLALLRDLVATDDPAVIALFVIRSDSYDALEHATALEGLSQKAFPLLPMPRGAYQTVIEGPAQRLERAGRKFEIDPPLTQALLADLEGGGGSDALPLLAFTLEQLFLDHEGAGRLTYADYKRFGGLNGAIEAAMARVFAEADKDPRIPKDRDARLGLLRRGLIPWLAGIDPETKTTRRRRAPAAQIPEEARPLIDLLVEQRLLSRAVNDTTHEITLEPAHEALLRQWGSLKGWLDEDFARLVTLEGVKRATRDWDANARDLAWIAHGGNRLEEATRLDTRPDLAALLDATDRAYLSACQEKESEAQAKELAFVAAERRAARRIRIGFVAVSILAVIAAGTALFGFLQAKVAGEQRSLAVQRGLVAEQRKTEAEQQSLKAEQRSAVLAASVSQAFTEEGALDQAFLLMLDASGLFDDSSVPDEIRIALTKTLEKRERIETRTLFPNMQVFEIDGALLLVDPVTKDIWKLTNSLDPLRFVVGTPTDSNILELRQTANGGEVIIVRENFDVERINPTTGARQKVATFLPPPQEAGATFRLDGTEITDDGLVVRDFSIVHTDNATAVQNYFQAIDPANGSLIQGKLNEAIHILRKASSTSLYALDYGNDQLLSIALGKSALSIKPIKLSDQDAIYARYGECISKMPAPSKKAAIASFSNFGYFRLFCKKVGDSYLVETVSPSSSGEERADTLYRPDGSTIDVRDIATDAASEKISSTNFNWVGMIFIPSKEDPAKNVDRLAILSNRNSYVFDGLIDAGDSGWSAVLDYRHPGFVKYGRFIGPDRLVVVDPEAGQLIAHDLGAISQNNFFLTSEDKILGSQTPVATLHRGYCGSSFSGKSIGDGLLPDGRKIIFATSDDKQSSDKHVLQITGNELPDVSLKLKSDCFRFSADWNRLLTVGDSTITIYDFKKTVENGVFAGNEVGSIPAGEYASAFFVGSTGDEIIVSDWSNRVLVWRQESHGTQWTSTQVYRGDNMIVYAEPDPTGDLLILIERLGIGDAHGLVYSTSAREEWLDLGHAYKYLEGDFTEKADVVVVADHNDWARAYPIFPLHTLVALARNELSPQCRPPKQNYRESPCWPATFH